MRMWRFAAIAFALVSLIRLTAQSPAVQAPQRDTPLQPQVGTATVSGRVVVNNATGRPVRHVFLLLSGGGLAADRMTTTDDEGRFEFTTLPAGRFTLSGWRNGFVRDFYGSKRPGSAGSPIIVADGQRVSITMRMTQSAVITGDVRLFGAPPEGSSVQVQAMKYQTINGERQLTYAGGTGGAIDERGTYRIYGLAPGEYIVATTTFFSSAPMRQVLPAEVQWALESASSSAAATPPEPARPVGFASVYFPGTTNPLSATPVTVGPGEERAGVDISLQLVPVSQLEGVVVGQDGRPPEFIQASLTMSMAASTPFRPYVSVRTLPEGKFIATGVMPGRYLLTIRGGARPGPPPAAGGPPPAPMLTPSFASFGTLEIDVDGRDQTGLVVRLQPGSTIAGKVTFTGETTPPGDPRTIRLTLSSGITSPGQMFGQPDADGVFTITGVPPGKYRLSAFAPNAPKWSLRSAILNGRDVIDETFEVVPGENVSGLAVTYTDQPSELTGTVLDASGKPADEYFIVAFSTDRKYWAPGSRRVTQFRPAQNGAYRISTLPAGEYFLCALTDLDPGVLYDPAFLESLMASSLKISFADGEKRVQDLKLAR